MAPPASNAVVTVHGDMNVRNGPGTDQERIGGATEGQEFAITGRNQDGDWWQIDFDGQSGWIYAPFVTASNEENVPIVDDSSAQLPAPAADTPSPEEPAVIVLGEMNIRSGAGTEYDIIGSATAGQEFGITGKNQEEDWWQIDLDGQTGWIYAPFVVASNAESVPVVAAALTPPADNSPPPATDEQEDAAPLATVNGLTNVRSGPGTNHPILGEASTGQQFAILGKSPDEEWWQIDFEGQTGWIYAPQCDCDKCRKRAGCCRHPRAAAGREHFAAGRTSRLGDRGTFSKSQRAYKRTKRTRHGLRGHRQGHARNIFRRVRQEFGRRMVAGRLQRRGRLGLLAVCDGD